MNTTSAPEPIHYDDILKPMMICGLVLSVGGVIAQVCLIAVHRQLRKFDEVILCEMTIARSIIGLCEFYVIYYLQSAGRCPLSYVVVTVYLHADVVLLTLMFLFTRNLFSKIVRVFAVRSYDLRALSLGVWLAPTPISIVYPLLWIMNFKYFETYYNVYAHVKFVVLTINMIYFLIIIYVTLKKRHERDRNLAKYLKTSVIVFLLVSVMSLQVLVTDLLAYYYDSIRSDALIHAFATVNSYQVVAIMLYFVLIVRNKINHPVGTSVRLSDMTVSATTTVSV